MGGYPKPQPTFANETWNLQKLFKIYKWYSFFESQLLQISLNIYNFLTNGLQPLQKKFIKCKVQT